MLLLCYSLGTVNQELAWFAIMSHSSMLWGLCGGRSLEEIYHILYSVVTSAVYPDIVRSNFITIN
jgi:hypothetical protein